MSYSAVIPAFNEAERIARVIEPCLQVPRLEQVLVVDDGSADDTSEAALAAGAHVLTMPKNGGKARAMHAGARAAEGDMLVFLDADLTGLKPQHVDLMLDAFEDGAQMAIGAIGAGTAGPSQVFMPILAGQRVIPKSLWMYLVQIDPRMVTSRFGVEIFLTLHANRHFWRVAVVILDGVGHTRKEDKSQDGFLHRIKMYREVTQAVVKAARFGPRQPVSLALKHHLLQPMGRFGYTGGYLFPHGSGRRRRR